MEEKAAVGKTEETITEVAKVKKEEKEEAVSISVESDFNEPEGEAERDFDDFLERNIFNSLDRDLVDRAEVDGFVDVLRSAGEQLKEEKVEVKKEVCAGNEKAGGSQNGPVDIKIEGASSSLPEPPRLRVAEVVGNVAPVLDEVKRPGEESEQAVKETKNL